jgi:beta-mannanase
MNLSLRPARKGCYDPATDRPGNVLSPTYFIAAWRHIHDIFVAAGATNVIWVWNESGGSPTPAEYYPGNDDVDWIGIDFYNPSSTPFTTMFTPVLNSVAQYQKPIMICETGALPSYQSAYFSQIVNTLESSFPLFKGVSYFDSGSGQSKGDWTLVGSGLAAYASMGQQAAFSAAPQL